MKRTTTFVMLLVLAAVGLTGASCKKTVNNVVNQVYSITYTVKPGDWQVHNKANNTDMNYIFVSLNVPEVDNIVVANGGVQVYLSFDNGASFNSIPRVLDLYSYTSSHSNGQVVIQETDESNNNQYLPPTPGSNILAKVVILDGAALQP